MVIMKLIGTSTVSIQNKITIIKPVAGVIDVSVGDQVAFLISDAGDIVLRNLSNVDVEEK